MSNACNGKQQGLSARQRIARWLMPHIAEVQNFKIKPEVDGDTLKVDVDTLRRSGAAQDSASAIRDYPATGLSGRQ